MASKLELEIELKTPAEKLWRNLKELATFFPKALPNIYKKIEVIEGDGRSVGSIFVATLGTCELNPVASTTKERIETVDEEKKTLSYNIIEGEVLKIYKNFKYTICVGSSKSGGTLIKYSAEFHKANAEIQVPQVFKELVAKLYHTVDDYLLKE